MTDRINRAPTITKFLTGHQLPGRPSFGCWASYGQGKWDDPTSRTGQSSSRTPLASLRFDSRPYGQRRDSRTVQIGAMASLMCTLAHQPGADSTAISWPNRQCVVNGVGNVRRFPNGARFAFDRIGLASPVCAASGSGSPRCWHGSVCRIRR